MVSYVLNNNANISIPPETRQRILDAIAQLDYVPNRAARELRTNQTRTIMCVVPDITNQFHTVFARGIQKVTRQHGYEFILYNTDRSASIERGSLQFIQQGRVDGVIMTVFYVRATDLIPLLEKGIAVVAQGPNIMPRQVRDYPLDSLHVDDSGAAHAAMTYLIERGHERIGMIAGNVGSPPRIRRERGYRETLREHGIEVDEALIVDGDFQIEGGYLGMKELLAQSPLVTAVFAASDLMAIGALRAIKEVGLTVPDDISIIGFDDIPLARLVTPALTTVAQFQEEMGVRAAQMLFERLEESAPDGGRHEVMPYELIVRESA
jgi:LacI family transcriptional regulator